MRSIPAVLASLAVVASLASPARADVAAAARAFSDGQAAQLGGDYDRAAQSFELAYSIAPSVEALRSAVRARMLGNQPTRAATLAELLLVQYPSDLASQKLATDVIADARPKLGRMAIACTASCSVAVGGRAVSITATENHVVYVRPGRQELEVTFDGGAPVARAIVLKAGDDLKVPVERPVPVPRPSASPARPVEPAPRPAPAPARATGLPPVVPITGGVVTLGLLGGAIWSALDTSKAHDAYVAHPTPEGWKAGTHKQLRTNLMFGGAAAAGVGTALVAVFWTRWHSERENRLTVRITPSTTSLAVTVRGRF